MRITVKMPKRLWAHVEQLAQSLGVTRSALIKGALQEYIARKRALSVHDDIKLPTFGGGGVLPGVNLDDSASLLYIMEEDAYRRLRDSQE